MNRRIASFDVFDTLLTRTWAEPRDLFVAVGQQLRAAGRWPEEAETFARRRCAAEAEARRHAPRGEVTLAEIYGVLAVNAGWSDAERTAAMAAELAAEASAIVAVPVHRDTVANARSGGAIVLFLSDMYLPGEFLRAQLARHGFWQEGDQVFVSGEEKMGKGSGLFARLLRVLGADAASWVHHGDNPHSDGVAPRRHGIVARLDQAAALTRRERTLRGASAFVAPWQSRLAGAARQARLAAPPGLDEAAQTLWAIGATVAGPLFWAFTRWSLQEAAAGGAKDVYFLAREGQIFHRIAGRLAQRPPLGLHYLLTSRLAFVGSDDRGNLDRLRQLAAPTLAFHSIGQALANLGIERASIEMPARWNRNRWSENLAPAERAELAEWLLSPPRLELVQAALARRADLARRYLQQTGLHARSTAAVVDTGWMGTIQKTIENLLSEAEHAATLSGFYLGLSPVREFACRGSSRGYTNAFRPLALRRDTTHLILLELLARADHGPLSGFEEREGAIEPLFGAYGAEQRESAARLQDAVLAFVEHIERAAPVLPPPDELARAVIGNYLDFFHHPEQAEALAIATVTHSDQMLERRHAPLCRPMSIAEAVRACADFHSRPPGWWLAGQARLGPASIVLPFLAAKRAKWWLKSCWPGQPL